LELQTIMKPIKDYINLLPQVEKKRAPYAMWGVLLALAFILVWLGMFGSQYRQYRSLRNRFATLSAQRQTLQSQADALRTELAIVSPTGMTRDKAALIQDILQERVLWSEVFKQLSHIVPTGLWFDYLEGIADGKAQIKIKGGAFNYISIADFMVSMEKSGYFEHPQLSYAQKTVVQGQDVVGFEIICGMKKGEGAR
jgi:Tfp pilus assembly protein PilN